MQGLKSSKACEECWLTLTDSNGNVVRGNEATGGFGWHAQGALRQLPTTNSPGDTHPDASGCHFGVASVHVRLQLAVAPVTEKRPMSIGKEPYGDEGAAGAGVGAKAGSLARTDARTQKLATGEVPSHSGDTVTRHVPSHCYVDKFGSNPRAHHCVGKRWSREREREREGGRERKPFFNQWRVLLYL